MGTDATGSKAPMVVIVPVATPAGGREVRFIVFPGPAAAALNPIAVRALDLVIAVEKSTPHMRLRLQVTTAGGHSAAPARTPDMLLAVVRNYLTAHGVSATAIEMADPGAATGDKLAEPLASFRCGT